MSQKQICEYACKQETNLLSHLYLHVINIWGSWRSCIVHKANNRRSNVNAHITVARQIKEMKMKDNSGQKTMHKVLKHNSM